MKKSKLLTATAVFSVAITAAVTTMSITSAYRGDLSQNNGFGQNRQHAPQITQEQREEIKTALENKDYEAWIELIPENSRHADLTEDEFEEFAEERLEHIEEMKAKRAEMKEKREAIQEALRDKDYEAFQELAPENGRHADLTEEEFLEKAEKFAERETHREEMKAAIESGDYETWAKLVAENGKNPQILEVINADNFDDLQEIHALKEAGEFEEAKEKASGLGIEPQERKEHRGFGEGRMGKDFGRGCPKQ